MRTSVIVPVYNQIGYTEVCLEALDRATPTDDWELIVVNNGSSDGTAAWLDGLRLEHAPVRVIHNRENLGFARACNQGLAIAEGDGMLLLNNDAVVTPGWQDGLWWPMTQDDGIGLTGPFSNATLGRACLPSVPYDQDLDWMEAFAAERAQTFCRQGYAVALLSGFCLLIRREVVDRIGGMDPLYGVGFFEDNDFAVRAQLAGYSLWACEDVFVHHYGSKTFNGAKFVKRDLIAEHWHLFKRKWGLPEDRTAEIAYGHDEIAERWAGDPAVPLYVPLTP